jgi:hypothetical protein
MIVVVSFRLYSFHFLFLYRHGVDDYLSLVYFQRVPWQTKLVDTFQIWLLALDGQKPSRIETV